MKNAPLKHARWCVWIALCGLWMFSGLTSCANLEDHEKAEEARERREAKREKEELKERLKVRNEAYSNIQDRRRLRKNAREDRYQEWWHRIMD